MKDEYSNINGYFKIEYYNGDELIDVYEDCNLVMEGARTSMQKLQGGMSDMKPINSLRLGTLGMDTSVTPNVPKTAGTLQNQYSPTRTNLFQDDTGTQGYVYVAKFNVDGQQQNTEINSISEKMRKNGTPLSGNFGTNQKLKRTQQDRVITFEVTIPQDSANAPTGSGHPQTMNYSEAQLYCDDTIFSMKTFYTKAKDNTTKLVVTWSIIF